MKTLILHVGTQKTATTTIQRFFADNREILSSKGFYYPIFPFKYPNKSRYRNGLFLSVKVWAEDGKRDIAEEERRMKYAMDDIHKAFETHDTVVLSDEALWRNLYRRYLIMDALMEDSLLHGYTIQVVIYLRRQDIYMESMWNQVVKTEAEYQTSFQEFLKDNVYDKHLDYLSVLSFYAERIGEENVIVRRFNEAVKSEGGILGDVMSQLGLELTDEYTFREDKSNSGLYGNEIRIMELVNQIEGIERHEHKIFREGLVRCSPYSKDAYRCSEFSEEERRAFMQPYEESNREIAERFIGDGKPLFSEDYSGPPKREDSNPHMTEDIVRSMASVDLTLYRKINKYNQKLESKIEELEKTIEVLEKRTEISEHRLDKLLKPFRAVSKKLKK